MKVDCIYHDNCLNVLKKLPNKFVDLVVTSPPYADNRKKTYEGIPIDDYTEWFLPISSELHRVLKPTGSFVLNIKERVRDGQRDTYILELILEMKKQGWLWTEEYIWHKRNSYPGKWPNRFRDAWERCLHFTKQKKFKMYQKEVMVPMGSWAHKRLQKLSKMDMMRYESRVNSGFGKNIANWVDRKKAYPTNVLHFATVCHNTNHSAAFPEGLPKWFIKLFTKPGDLVLDPFIGSGTTAVVCKKLNRHFIGVELKKEYYNLAVKSLKELEVLSHITSTRKNSKKKLKLMTPQRTLRDFN